MPAAIAHRRTVTVPLEETNPIQENPAPGSAAGETLTAMLLAAPLTLTVALVQEPALRALPPRLPVVPVSAPFTVAPLESTMGHPNTALEPVGVPPQNTN